MDYHALSLSVAGSLLRSQTAPTTPPGRAGGRQPWSVTVSREVGALGSAVGAEVARRLSYPLYDRQILDKVAEEMRRPTFHLEAVDERRVGWLENALSSLLSDYHVDADAYLKYLIGTVRGLALSGPGVFVGRGATWILPAATNLRVRLVADRADRVRNMAQRLGCSEREAASWVERTEQDRGQFARRHFNVDPDDPHHYDLCLNVSRLSVGDCADLSVEALRRFEARGPAARAAEGAQQGVAVAY
jgi:cytidylate kinase